RTAVRNEVGAGGSCRILHWSRALAGALWVGVIARRGIATHLEPDIKIRILTYIFAVGIYRWRTAVGLRRGVSWKQKAPRKFVRLVGNAAWLILMFVAGESRIGGDDGDRQGRQDRHKQPFAFHRSLHSWIADSRPSSRQIQVTA